MPNRFPSCCGNSMKLANWPASRKPRRTATSWWKKSRPAPRSRRSALLRFRETGRPTEIASGSGLERLRVHDSACLVDGHQAVGSDCLEALTDAAGPTHLHIGGLLGAEAEVQSPVIHRQEARLPGDLLDLLAAAVTDQRAGADGAAGGFGGAQLQLERSGEHTSNS